MRALHVLAAGVLAVTVTSSAVFAEAPFPKPGQVVTVGGKKCLFLGAPGSVLCPGEGPKCVPPCVLDPRFCEREPAPLCS